MIEFTQKLKDKKALLIVYLVFILPKIAKYLQGYSKTTGIIKTNNIFKQMNTVLRTFALIAHRLR